MKKLYLLSFFFLCFVALPSQKNQVSEGAESITIKELRDHMFYLASDELEGRKSGTDGYDKAAQYIVNQLRRAGLSPVCKNNDSTLSYYQEITIDKYSPGPDNTITIVKNSYKRTYSFEDNFLINYGGPFETKELSGRMVFVGAGIRESEYGIDNYKNIDVNGKWAVILEDSDTDVQGLSPIGAGRITSKFKKLLPRSMI